MCSWSSPPEGHDSRRSFVPKDLLISNSLFYCLCLDNLFINLSIDLSFYNLVFFIINNFLKKINIDSHRNRNYNLYSFNVSIPHFFFFSITGSNTTILQQDYSKIYRYTFLRLYFSITGELVDKCTIHGIIMDAVQLFLVLLASSRYFLHPIGKSTHNNPNLKLRFIRLIASSRYNRDNS